MPETSTFAPGTAAAVCVISITKPLRRLPTNGRGGGPDAKPVRTNLMRPGFGDRVSRPWTLVPDGWAQPPPDLLAHAKDKALEALKGNGLYARGRK
jgi:hypothetical protein